MSSVSELLGLDQQTSDSDIELCYDSDSHDSDYDNDDCTTNDEASGKGAQGVQIDGIGGNDTVASEHDSGSHSDVDDQVPKKVHDNEAGDECGSESALIPDVMSQRAWRQKFIKRNPLYRRVKIRYCNVAYIKPRCAIPATGKPVLYVCEGAENWNGPPNLLCAGQVLIVEKNDWVILAVLWVGCISKKVGGRVQYSCAGKSMRVLLCPRGVFDDAEGDLSSSENELR